MPKIFHRQLRPPFIGELGLWQISEPEVFFLEQLNLTKVEENEIAALKGHRRLEWLSGRLLLHDMSGRAVRGACLKDEFGKPYLLDSPYHISISHSNNIVAIIASPRSVGIDVQKLVGKIERIAHKYMRPEEMESLHDKTRLEHLHVYWGAKEALYKAYGRRKLDFRKHILIEPFEFDLQQGLCKGAVKKEDFHARYLISYVQLEEFILVTAIEETETIPPPAPTTKPS
ncbi:MAG: 4'-phosphopantetheinyl transferase superfamily protein [Bacteroidota bacterium]